MMAKHTPSSSMPAPLSLMMERMTVKDVPAVAALARLCFPEPWSATTFQRDLEHNTRSVYWVVRHIPPWEPATDRNRQAGAIVAYGGLWLLDDEAHIVTLATHPDWRKRQVATWLLQTMLAHARLAGGQCATLEVRASNTPARRLYERFGFREVGRRKGYYTLNPQTGEREDALLLDCEL